MNSKIRKLLLIVLLSVISLIIPNSVRADESETSSVDKSSIPVEYTIKINKIDTESKELLKGAVFDLKNKSGDTVRTATTDENGTLTFDKITTYGEGTDIYYIEESSKPQGYTIEKQEVIELNITKKISEEGAYHLDVNCQTLNYITDITRYEYIPLSTPEDLKKIGSGAVVEYEGAKYTYSANANYQLINDIDLDGIDWEPINKKISGIFDGNGYSIKNLTISKEENLDYSEVGLFKYFSGMVQGLNLENVNINVPGFVEKAESISSQQCVGGFAGFMEKGVIKDCKISGTINANSKNVGGFVGHSAKDNIIKFQDCTNNATINVPYEGSSYTLYNIGGMIGCALGSLSFDNCTNNGNIKGTANNVGGLVGYVKSTSYNDFEIKAGFTQEDNMITLLIGNSKTTSNYDIVLENIDTKTLGLISGAKYTVYNSKLEAMPQYKEIELKDGKLKIPSIDIKFLGKDTYYIKEVKTAPGYSSFKNYVKLIVTRYWDAQLGSFRVSVEAENISEKDIDNEDKKDNTNEELTSATGNTYVEEGEQLRNVKTQVDFEDNGSNSDRVLFINCSNTANITGRMNASGILGAAHCKIGMNECSNLGKIEANGSGKAGGMVAELYAWKLDDTEILNCSNSGEVISNGGNGSAGGIIANVAADLKVKNCSNSGKISSQNQSGVAGIIADGRGIITIDYCRNDGEILSAATSSYTDVNSVGAGIFAKNLSDFYGIRYAEGMNDIYTTKEDNIVTITNCENYGNITSFCHTGGILAISDAKSVVITDCTVGSKDKKVKIYDIAAADKGGIAGYLLVPNVKISNCNVNNIELIRTSNICGNTYGATGGIVGTIQSNGWHSTPIEKIEITNCNVTNSNIESKGQSTGGIFGFSYNSSKTDDIIIKSCYVGNCEVLNKETTGTYGGSSGIFAASYYANNITIEDCIVEKTSIESRIKVGSTGGDSDAGGLIGVSRDCNYYNIKNCDVLDSTVTNVGYINDGCSVAGGIAGSLHSSLYNKEVTCNIMDCNVLDTDVKTNAGTVAGIVASWHCSSYNELSIIVDNCNFKHGEIYGNPVTTSASIVSGMVGFSEGEGKISDCKVDDAEIKQETENQGAGTNTAGFLGMCQYSYEFYDCDITNSTLYSKGNYSNCANVAGIAGTLGSGAHIFNNCNVDETDITGTLAANVAGILGATYGYGSSLNLDECNVTNSIITSDLETTRSSTNSTASGIVGSAYVDVVANNLNVEKTNIFGKGVIVAGAIACAKNLDADNISVQDVDLIDNGTNQGQFSGSLATRSIGGIVGAVTEDFYGDKLTVDDLTINSHSVSVGGIAGFIKNLHELKNSSVNELNAENSSEMNASKGSIAGFVGDAKPASSVDISNNTVTDSIIKTSSDNASGFIGTITQGDAEIDKVKIIDVTIENKNEYSTSLGNVGGIVAYSENNLNINNTEVKDSDFSISQNLGYKHIGGLVGFSNDITVDNTKVTSTSITNKCTSGMTGGFVGMTNRIPSPVVNQKTLTVSNSSVEGKTKVRGYNHIGGMLGLGKIIANKNDLNDIIVEVLNQNGSAGTGGLVGNVEPDSEINGVTADNVTIQSKYQAGGIAGIMKGNISNVNISNSKVSVTSESTSNLVVGGIVGVLYGDLIDSTVDNIQASSSAGDVGGAVGCTTYKIENVSVKNSHISSPKLSGGVIGAGLANSTELINLTVEENTIEGGNSNEGPGDYIGAPNIYKVEESTNEEDLLDTALEKVQNTEIEKTEISDNKEKTEEQNNEEFTEETNTDDIISNDSISENESSEDMSSKASEDEETNTDDITSKEPTEENDNQDITTDEPTTEDDIEEDDTEESDSKETENSSDEVLENPEQDIIDPKENEIKQNEDESNAPKDDVLNSDNNENLKNPDEKEDILVEDAVKEESSNLDN